MARNRDRMDDLWSGPERGRRRDMNDDRIRGGAEDDVRGVGDDGDEDLEDADDLEDEEDEDASY